MADGYRKRLLARSAAGALAAVFVATAHPPAATADGSPACRAYDRFSEAVLPVADTELVQILRGVATNAGVGMGGAPTAERCAAALAELRALGVDPFRPDGGLSIARERIAAKDDDACAIVEIMIPRLIQFGGPEMEGLLLDLSEETGLGAVERPDSALCARFVEAATARCLDMSEPDGGLAAALSGRSCAARPAGGAPGPVGGYDPQPDDALESAEWRSDRSHGFATPTPGMLKFVETSEIVAVVAPPGQSPDGLRAAPGEPDACLARRGLSDAEAFRAWATMRELMRYFGAPGEILSGRDCALVEYAVEASFATTGDPSYADDPDEIVPVFLDRRLDGDGLDSAGRDAARAAVTAMAAAPVPTETHPWRVLFASPEVALAAFGASPPAGGALVWSLAERRVVATFRMNLPGEAP